jgi:CheY-like chemotaxis protein
VRALTAPDRQVQLAAAQGLVELNLDRPYAGSHQVVPALARFIAGGRAPRAVVIDGNLSRGNQVASVLKELGYETDVAGTGPEGFERAAASADVELVVLDPTALRDPWRARDTLSNLRADARTRGIPILVTGGLEVRERERSMLEDFPGVAFVVTPIDPALAKAALERELERQQAQPLSPEQRAKLAAAALETLRSLARRGAGPYTRDLPQATAAVTARLRDPGMGELAAEVLGELPCAEAQRALAACAIDPAMSLEVRRKASDRLAASIRKLGPQVTPDQERKLLETLDLDTEDPALRSGLAAVIGALKPRAQQSGQRLRQLEPPPAPRASGPTAVEAEPAPGP